MNEISDSKDTLLELYVHQGPKQGVHLGYLCIFTERDHKLYDWAIPILAIGTR